MKTVKVTTKNVVSIIDVDFDNYKDIQRAIGGHFETVHTQLMADYFKDPSVIMLVDEDGHHKELTENAIGTSFLAPAPRTKCVVPIVGDLIFAQISGEDIVAPDDAEQLKLMILNRFVGLKEKKVE